MRWRIGMIFRTIVVGIGRRRRNIGRSWRECGGIGMCLAGLCGDDGEAIAPLSIGAHPSLGVSR